jgi:hypothetical protein
MRKPYRRISPALVVSVLALVLALTGGAVAAGITGGQITNNTITGKDVKNRSLTKADFRGSVRGPRGFQGAAGPQGPAGPAGIAGITLVNGAERSYPSGDYGGAPTAHCPAGSAVVGTGFNGPFDAVGGLVKSYGTFVGGFFSNQSSITVSGSVQAICARTTATVAARATRQQGGLAAFRADVTAATAEARR